VDTVAGWELFGRTADALIRIDPARGRITRTPVPRIGSTGPASLVVGRDWAMLRPLDFVPGYLIPDGQPARELTGVLNQGGMVAPGPDGASLWISAPPGYDTVRLVDLNGRPAGPEIEVPLGMDGTPIPDGTGYLVFNGVGGSYAARPEGVRRITTGALIAIGPTRWLAYECDERYACGIVVIDRRTGAHRKVSDAAIQPSGPSGVVSSDGAQAAVTLGLRTAPPTLSLMDLASGELRGVFIPNGVRTDAGGMVWSPDGRWLFVTGAGGRVFAIDRAGTVHDLGPDLPSVIQLTVRSTLTPLS
jgi:hypothetical protein